MTPLAPAPILAAVMAELAHEWTMRLATGRLAVTPEEATVFAAALRELAISAREMSATFQRVLAERNELLGITRAAKSCGAAEPRPAHGSVIDLSEFFAREQADRAHQPGGAS